MGGAADHRRSPKLTNGPCVGAVACKSCNCDAHAGSGLLYDDPRVIGAASNTYDDPLLSSAVPQFWS